jgi:putative SOS response-associated peptidase YedK
MCGRFTLTLDEAELVARFDLKASDAAHTPRFNIAPTQMAPVVLNESPDRLSVAQWGLIPSWAKDPTIGARMINARAETAQEKPSFRTAFKRRRCLVPADGFYEWRKTEGAKVPLYIRLKTGEPFALAGLWEVWKPPEGDPVRTFTILTAEPNELLATIHNRMPVILPRENEQAWLDNTAGPVELMAMLQPYSSELMEAYEVSKRVNSPRSDEPALIERVN